MLKVGINWLSPHALPTVRRLLEEGVADFCEIMVDNAVHLPPEKIRAALPNVPLALHIVNSNFLTKPINELQDIAQHLRPWIADLNPLYVSDHLPQLNYQTDYANTAERVTQWQDLIGMKLLLENFPSMSAAGRGQAEFYARLIQETQCDLLFDFSNAYIAEYNLTLSSRQTLSSRRRPGSISSIAVLQAWAPLLEQTRHFHVAGFRIDPKTKLAYDTHDTPIADEVLAFMRPYFSGARGRTIVFELDTHLDYELAKEEITRLRTALSGAANDAAMDVAATDGDKRRVQGRTFLSASLAAPLKAASNSDPKQNLISMVTEWALRGFDHIPAKGIIMRSKEASDLAIGLWKNTEPDQPHKIVLLDITAENLPPANAYAISYQAGSWVEVEWKSVAI